jgi:acetyl esterase/lipase
MGIDMVAVTTHRDLEYANVGGTSLTLDLHRPDTGGPVPVVVFLHGGAWQVGDKTDHEHERLVALAAHGIAVASANYRLAAQATHPAQVHDVKAVVRWLRAHGAGWDLATGRVGIWGASAGAYLASMVGLTPGDAELEGSVGDDLDQRSDVQAVVSWFGQSDLRTNALRSWLEQELLAPPVEQGLLGVDDVPASAEVARRASPLYRVTATAPPFLIAHGDRDRITPVGESQALHDALVRAGAQSTFLLVGGAGHEGPAFDRPDHIRLTAAFLLSHLTEGASR